MSLKLTFNNIIEKIERQDRFSFSEGCELLSNTSLSDLARAGDYARKKKVGEEVYYIDNKHLYYSNICEWQCKFCAFSRYSDEPQAYTKSPEQILNEIGDGSRISEVRITGGMNPELGVEYFSKVFSLIKGKYPHIHIEALAPTEIDFIARLDKLSHQKILVLFKEAGLGSLAAGGAEIASERVRNMLCREKSPFNVWLQISKIAHELGIASNASILYGHIETINERVEHILKIRELQDETGGFNAFIPLKYIENKKSGIKSTIRDRSEDLRMFAVSRLLLDNFKHIKALWLFYDADIIKDALNAGVNDIGGTVNEEYKGVARTAGSPMDECLTKEKMERSIREAGRKPVERGRLYERKIAINE